MDCSMFRRLIAMTVFDDIMTSTAGEPVLRESLGETVTYHPDGAADVPVEGIFAGRSADLVEAEPGGSSDLRTGTFLVAKTQLAAATRNDKLTIRSSKWSVISIDDLGYAWRLNIRRSVAVERGAGQFRMPRI